MAPKVPAKDKKDCPPTKKPKIEPNTPAVQTGDGPSKSASSFVKQIEEKRLNTAKSVLEFKFNKKRCRVLSTAMEIPSDRSGGILYWMSREQRVQDNWALLYAQRLALKHKLPLHVCFVLVPKFLEATIRHFGFILKGLQGVEEELGKLNIPFHLLLGEAPQRIPELVKKLSLNGVVADFAPLRVPLTWVDKVKQNLPKDVPFCQVDAHNIVPCWVASEKQEVGARTIRKKIHDKLDEFLTEFPPVIKHPHNKDAQSEKIDWNAADASLEVNRTIKEVDWAKPGTQAALQELESFCTQRLKIFGDKRNDPNVKALSRLSPWLHYGQISAQRCILEVKPFKSKYSSGVDAFIEEAVVRRELSDNFCFYNKNYDNLDGAAAWARKTLDDHRKDKRGMLFNQEQLEEGKTHDDLWNAAQIQMVREGKMHGFLRMYWAKKILEWTESPEEALRIAIYLNDKYSLDGRDPNGYVGCMWSICGIHDQGWAEREVFGKIRYMNYQGCKRKFDVDAFVLRYGAKAYHYPQKKY